jgi:hypothetical protein
VEFNGIENQSPYNFEAILYTSFGQVVKTFNVTGTTPFYEASLDPRQIYKKLG